MCTFTQPSAPSHHFHCTLLTLFPRFRDLPAAAVGAFVLLALAHLAGLHARPLLRPRPAGADVAGSNGDGGRRLLRHGRDGRLLRGQLHPPVFHRRQVHLPPTHHVRSISLPQLLSIGALIHHYINRKIIVHVQSGAACLSLSCYFAMNLSRPLETE